MLLSCGSSRLTPTSGSEVSASAECKHQFDPWPVRPRQCDLAAVAPKRSYPNSRPSSLTSSVACVVRTAPKGKGSSNQRTCSNQLDHRMTNAYFDLKLFVSWSRSKPKTDPRSDCPRAQAPCRCRCRPPVMAAGTRAFQCCTPHPAGYPARPHPATENSVKASRQTRRHHRRENPGRAASPWATSSAAGRRGNA